MTGKLVLLAGAAAVAVVVLLRLFDPAASLLFPPCPLYYFTGLYCPGCGSLRAFHQLLQGNLWAAFAMNPLAMVALPFVLYGSASYARFQLQGRFLPRWFIPPGWIWTLGAVIVLYGVARNLPFYPFSLLAPGGMLRL